MSNRYRDSMYRLHFTQEQKQEMVDRLMEAGPVSSCLLYTSGPRYRNRSTVNPVFFSRKARSSSGAAPVTPSLSQSWPWFFPRMSTR